MKITAQIRAAALIVGLTLGLSSAQASCVGSSTFYTCNDNSGNSYTVQKNGGTTMMNGYNANTGSNWSQNSYSNGSTTNVYGSSSNGSSWNQTITPSGTYGTDSQGNSFYSPRPYRR